MKADRDDSEEDEPVSEPALVRLDSVQTDLLEVLKDWNSFFPPHFVANFG